MSSRRQFIKQGSIGSAALALGMASCNNPSAEEKPTESAAPPVVFKDGLVLSTWNHGMAANDAAWKIIAAGGNALDAAEAGVRITESDLTNLSVGLGGLPDRDGHTTLDACIMDHKGRAGSVSFLEKIEHPISVARMVMEKTPHVMLVGEGAQRFAIDNGFQLNDYKNPEAVKAWKEWLVKSEYKPIINVENHDTIGLVAMDLQGDFAGSCTTSGLSYKLRGRVGDSPIIGAGLYVDNEVGAATSTGLGEAVIRTCSSFLIVELMRQGATPQQACEEATQRLIKRHDNYMEFQVGFIAMNKAGSVGAFSIQSGFEYAMHTSGKQELIKAGSFVKG